MTTTTMPLYRVEFPAFGELDVQLPEGFEDTSWHNDACPSFEAKGVRVWVDFKNPEDRESDASKRFAIVPLSVDANDHEPLLTTDDWTGVVAYLNRIPADVPRLAMAFANQLREDIGAKKVAKVVALNAEQDNPNICHSHDFCDANMTMDAAFTKTVGREIDLQSDDDMALWNDAWTLAKANGFDADKIRNAA